MNLCLLPGSDHSHLRAWFWPSQLCARPSLWSTSSHGHGDGPGAHRQRCSRWHKDLGDCDLCTPTLALREPDTSSGALGRDIPFWKQSWGKGAWMVASSLFETCLGSKTPDTTNPVLAFGAPMSVSRSEQYPVITSKAFHYPQLEPVPLTGTRTTLSLLALAWSPCPNSCLTWLRLYPGPSPGSSCL